jgi:hypothetical protein
MVKDLLLFVIPVKTEPAPHLMRGIHVSILMFPVFTGTSLDSRWSLPRTLMRGGNDNFKKMIVQ